MKKIFFSIVVFLIFSCETERIIFKGSYHVRFTDVALTEKESYSKPVKIEVHNAGPALDQDVIVSYSIKGSAREGVDFVIVSESRSVTIEAGEYFGYIEVLLINNANNILRSQDVIFTLNTVNTSKLRVGQSEGGIGKAFKLTINDDCILGGFYTGTRDNLSTPLTGINLTSSDCENYLVSDWNIQNPFGLDHLFGFSLMFKDNGDNTLKIENQKPPEFFDEEKNIEGTGTVNPVTREIRLTIKYEGQESTITLIPE
jgi:hypothetical protein